MNCVALYEFEDMLCGNALLLIYCQSKDTEDFYNLLGKLVPLTLNHNFLCQFESNSQNIK